MEMEGKNYSSVSSSLSSEKKCVFPSSNILSLSSPERVVEKIKEAIALNLEAEEKLILLENKLRIRLQECIEKQVKQGKDGAKPAAVKLITYAHCVMPYFKGPVPPPSDNEDSHIMKNLKMHQFYHEQKPHWTKNDKLTFIHILKKVLKKKKHNEIYSVINKLKMKGKDNASIHKEIDKCYEELSRLNVMKLKELIKLIDKNFDWEVVTKALNYRHNGEACRAMWNLFLHPRINKLPWTRQERRNLENIAYNYNMEDWDEIAETLNTGRSGYQCFVYYKDCICTKTFGVKWSRDEEENLRKLVEYGGKEISWPSIAAQMENRTKSQIYGRWIASTQPNLRKGRFLPEEDSVLLACAREYGADYKKISEYIPGRTAIQLRLRYKILTRSCSADWTIDEDKMLMQLMASHGNLNCYSEIVKHFPGKNRCNLRTRHKTLQKWVIHNPHADISFAPRRPPRHLNHGLTASTLDAAVEKLNKKLLQISHNENSEQDVTNTKRQRKEVIIDSIILAFVNEYSTDKVQKAISNRKQAPYDTMEKKLLLLRAYLDKAYFDTRNYPELSTSNDMVKSYPNKTAITLQKSMQTNSHQMPGPNIWGKIITENSAYVLHPHLATITGCNAVLRLLSNKCVRQRSSVQTLRRSNAQFSDQWKVLLHRFQVLFMWPLLLSNLPPLDNIT